MKDIMHLNSNTICKNDFPRVIALNLNSFFTTKTQFFGICFFSFLLMNFSSANAYPIFAQQNYSNPREANGRIVCANCHLAQKPVEIEVPQSVLQDTVF